MKLKKLFQEYLKLKKLNEKKQKTIALIAARKGSKGVKNKNLIKFGKKNIVNLAVLIGLKTALIDKVLLSSDMIKY